MPIEILPPDDMRLEILVFADNSELRVNAHMRCDCGGAYRDACKLATGRRFPTVIDGKEPVTFPDNFAPDAATDENVKP
jgi:hypothetical protein